MLKKYIPAISTVLFILIIWELVVRSNAISKLILPSPFIIIRDLADNREIITTHSIQTLVETVIGLFVSVLLGIFVGVLIDSSTLIRKSLYPLLVTSQTIPMIALAPLLLIWFGFDLVPKVIIVVLYCFFPIAINFMDGLSSTRPELINLLKSMGASNFQILKLVKIPAALPYFFSGLRIAATYSVTGAIIGEFVGSYNGLGVYMIEMANSHSFSLVFAAIFVVIVLSLALFSLVNISERILIPWHFMDK